MGPINGAIPKTKQSFKRSSKTPRTPPQATGTGNGDESTYQCEICLITDNQDKVCCDLCQLWYHFKCANVTSDVATRHWACVKCEGVHQNQSTPNKPNEEIIPNPTVTSTNSQDNPSGAAGQASEVKSSSQGTDSQVPPGQYIDGEAMKMQSTANLVIPQTSDTKVDKSAKSRKSISISSSVSRRTALALQRLEEEKQLREKREREDQKRREKYDKEYLDKKYSLLENDSDEDINIADEDLEILKRDRTQQWSVEVTKENHPAVEINLLDPMASNVGVKSIINKLNRSESVQPSTQRSQKRTEKIRRSSPRSNASIRKVKEIATTLPSWLTAPSKTISNLFDPFGWKATSSVSKPAISTCSAPATHSSVDMLSLNNLSLLIPQKTNNWTQILRGTEKYSHPILSMTTATSKVPSVSLNDQLRTSVAQGMQSITSSSTGFMSKIESTTSNVYQRSVMMNPSMNIKSNLSMASTSNQSIVSNPSRSAISQSFVPITNYSLPVMPNNNQSSQTRPNPTSTNVFSSANDQRFYFGLRPTTSANVTQSNVGQSSTFTYPSGPQVVQTDSQQVPSFVISSSMPQPSANHTFSGYSHGASSVNVNNTPLMTTGFSLSSGQTSYGPSYSSNIVNSNASTHGSTNHSYQPYVGNMNSMGVMAPSMNHSTASTNRPRLTAEQIASRHVIPKLPHFFGEPKYWQAFKSAYDYSTEACGFTNVENLGRLQESVKGDARVAVGSRLLHPNSVPAVMNTLQMMYGRPELIIESMIESIKREPSPKDDDLASLIKFAISVQNLCGSIQETGALEHLRNPTLMNAITDKLPTQIQLNWAYYRHSVGVVDLSNLGDWLYNLADIASQVVRKPNTKVGKKRDNDKKDSEKSINYLNTQVESKSKKKEPQGSNKKGKCLACKSESCSKIPTCKKFKNWSRSERWTFLKENKLCSRCLGGHSFYRCRSDQSCKAEGCTKKHHTLLHDHEKSETSKNEKKSSDSESKPVGSEIKPPISVCNSQRSINNRTDVFRIVPVVLYNKNNVIRDFASLDDGSNLTLMEDGLADELELVGTPQAVCIDWAFGQSHESEESRIVTAKISGFYHQAPSYKLENVRTVKDLHLPTQSLTSAWLERYPYLKNIPIVTYEAVKPRMLIGLQYSKLTVSLETIEGAWEEPMACRTRLGWVVQGPSYSNDNLNQKKFSLNLCQCQSKDNELHKLVKEYFSIENFGVKMNDKFLESKQVQRARQILETTTVKKNGRYESGLLWKYDQVDLPNSYNMALKRLQCLESKMAKNPQLAENLCNQIKQFVEKGYVRKLSSIELQVKNDREWYLPIFPVFNPKKPEKVRIVWDAAAKVKNVSLNSLLLTGPDLLVPLVDILRRFRERLIAVLADIREMYHQIQIIEQDQNVQRFLWRDGDSTKNPETYVMIVATFGAACSPCTAQFVKNKNANEHKQQFPDAVAAITHNTYVDDLLDCSHEVEEAIKLAKDVQYVNQQGGFDTRNFLSNSKEVLEKIGERNAQQSKNLNINTDLTLGTERVLGMFWNAETDNFIYSLKYTKVNQNILSGIHCPTKREVLRILMSIFDPLGLLASFLVYAKILLQEIWRSNIEWDEQISRDSNQMDKMDNHSKKR